MQLSTTFLFLSGTLTSALASPAATGSSMTLPMAPTANATTGGSSLSVPTGSASGSSSLVYVSTATPSAGVTANGSATTMTVQGVACSCESPGMVGLQAGGPVYGIPTIVAGAVVQEDSSTSNTDRMLTAVNVVK
ncbi:hypothetical protein K438DRAFT_1748235 [Mycena galopus ATCC 62051]|nr:hypothetical protein K438DRAFT_1748235 [Mycena galopus ATCC 62051]